MILKREEYNWTDLPVKGIAILVLGGSIDIFGNQIKGNKYYKVGKHKKNGRVVIIPIKILNNYGNRKIL